MITQREILFEMNSFYTLTANIGTKCFTSSCLWHGNNKQKLKYS